MFEPTESICAKNNEEDKYKTLNTLHKQSKENEQRKEKERI